MFLFRRVPQEAIEAQNTAQLADARAYEADRQADRNEQDIERLLMVTEALWRIVKQKHGLGDRDLEQLVEAIDLEDGFLDGKVRRVQEDTCDNCQKTITRNRSNCLYCGQAIASEVFAR